MPNNPTTQAQQKKIRNQRRTLIGSIFALILGALTLGWLVTTSDSGPNAVPSHFDGDFRRLINSEQKKAIARQRKSMWENDEKTKRIKVWFGRTSYQKDHGVCRYYYTETLYEGQNDRWQGLTCKNPLGKWFRY